MFQAYFTGKTAPITWKDTIRHHQAPWGELEAPGNVIFTAPSFLLKKLRNPVALMKYWNEAMIVASNFAGFPNGKRERAERFVFDVHIGSGEF